MTFLSCHLRIFVAAARINWVTGLARASGAVFGSTKLNIGARTFQFSRPYLRALTVPIPSNPRERSTRVHLARSFVRPGRDSGRSASRDSGKCPTHHGHLFVVGITVRHGMAETRIRIIRFGERGAQHNDSRQSPDQQNEKPRFHRGCTSQQTPCQASNIRPLALNSRLISNSE